MKNVDIFDVLIVYSENMAKSASSPTYSGQTPFPKNAGHGEYNDTYAYLLKVCRENNLTAAFTTSGDITGAGRARSYWTTTNNKWVRIKKSCYSSFIFEKFFPRSSIDKANRKLLLSSKEIKMFSSDMILNLFFDKFKTSKDLSEYTSPTVKIDTHTPNSVKYAVNELKKMLFYHPTKADFTTDFILKDRHGAGGENVYKIDTDHLNEISTIINANKGIHFILQPFLKFDTGFNMQGHTGQTEIRFIFKGSEIMQTYIRMSGEKELLCNNGQGGVRIDLKYIPKSVTAMANKIAHEMNQANEIFALDFVVSNDKNVYLLEGNSSPGINWYKKFPENEKMNKEMIGVIVNEIVRRSDLDKLILTN